MNNASPIQKATRDLAKIVNCNDDAEKQVILLRRAGETLSAYRGRIPAENAVHIASLLVDIHGRALQQKLKEQQSNGCFVVSTMSSVETAANSTLEYDSIPIIRTVLERNDGAINQHLIKKIVNYGMANDKTEESPLTQLLVDLARGPQKASELVRECLGKIGGETAERLKLLISGPSNEGETAGLRPRRNNTGADAARPRPHELLAARYQ